MQLKLSFFDPPTMIPPPWEDLDTKARRAFVQTLARAIAKAIGRPLKPQKPEKDHDR